MKSSKSNKGKSYKTKQNEDSLKKLGQPLTVDIVKALLQPKRLITPEPEVLERLHTKLIHIRSRAQIENRIRREAYAINDSIRKHGEALIDLLSKKIESHNALNDPLTETFVNSPFDNVMYPILDHLSLLLNSTYPSEKLIYEIKELLNSRAFMVPRTDDVNFQDTWPAILKVLKDAFDVAMRPTNPTARLTLHANSPGAKFLSGVIPYLTGDTATPGAVAARWTALRGEN